MLLNYDIHTNLKVESLMDLSKLKLLEDKSNLKVNKSELGRKFGVGRRTIACHIDLSQIRKDNNIIIEWLK